MSKAKENIEPIYFMDLVVENVRCFKDAQLMDLSDGKGRPARWTIILGDNGTGKTTLLKSITFLRPHGHNFSKVILPYGTVFFIENGKSYPRDIEKSIFFGSNRFSIGKLTKTKNKIVEGYNFAINSPINSPNDSPAGFAQPSSIFEKNNLLMLAYGAQRYPNESSIIKLKNSSNIQNLFDSQYKLINPEAWLLEADFAIKNAKNSTKKYLQDRYNKVQETLKKLLPDIQDFRIKEITKTNIQAAIEVKTPYGWVDMKNLSLGYQTFIAWVVDLAARLFDHYPDSDNPLEEPCIVLVDEIDLHLHPKWQRKIIGFLTDIFKNAQFIVTAHSPLIVQAAADANIVLLKREGDSVRIHNNMDEQAIDDWRFDQILTSELFGLDSARSPKYDAYLERKKVILEKDKLTKKDENELEKIAKKLDEIPLNDKQANDAIEALKRATAILKAS